MAVLARDAPVARAHLEAALKRAPDAPEASERWLELARVTWQLGQRVVDHLASHHVVAVVTRGERRRRRRAVRRLARARAQPSALGHRD